MSVLGSAVGCRLDAKFLSSFAHAGCENFEYGLGVFPTYAGIGDGDTVLQAGFAFFGDFLVACGSPKQLAGPQLEEERLQRDGKSKQMMRNDNKKYVAELTFADVTLNHDTHDCLLALLDLLGDDLGDLGLVTMVLLTVPVRAVNHDLWSQALGRQLLLGLSDALLVVVGAGGATAQDDETVLIPDGAHDSDDAGFGDGEEMMRMTYGTDGVNGDTQRTICPVLEADWERQAGR